MKQKDKNDVVREYKIQPDILGRYLKNLDMKGKGKNTIHFSRIEEIHRLLHIISRVYLARIHYYRKFRTLFLDLIKAKLDTLFVSLRGLFPHTSES